MLSVYAKSLFLFIDGSTKDLKDQTNVALHFEMLPGEIKKISGDIPYAEKKTEEITSRYISGFNGDQGELLTGDGIEKWVKLGYEFLYSNYSDGDEIILIGFSRGAATARYLASILGKYSLSENTLTEVESIMHGDSPELEKGSVPVKFLGLYDTVESIQSGVEILSMLRRVKKRNFMDMLQVVDNVLAPSAKGDANSLSNVEDAYHAVAINEYRKGFEYTPLKGFTEEYFVGDHTLIGGQNSSKRQFFTLNEVLKRTGSPVDVGDYNAPLNDSFEQIYSEAPEIRKFPNEWINHLHPSTEWILKKYNIKAKEVLDYTVFKGIPLLEKGIRKCQFCLNLLNI